MWAFFRRYIAVTQPIKYAKHKNNRRVWLTIVLVWAISAAIGSPIVLGLNNTPDRTPDLCLFYNSNFIIYSSLSSFYIPCIIMVFLYWNIFKVSPARKTRTIGIYAATVVSSDTPVSSRSVVMSYVVVVLPVGSGRANPTSERETLIRPVYRRNTRQRSAATRR